MTSQSETSCLKFRMLQALYNLAARENSTVTFQTIMSRAYDPCLACQPRGELPYEWGRDAHRLA